MDGGPVPPGPFNQGNHEPGRITWNGVWLKRVLQVAYDLPSDRISGPGWLDSDRYNIVATVPKGTSEAEFKRMVQGLLAERFRMTLHRETKDVSGYVLEIAKNGPKLTKSGDASRPDPAAADQSQRPSGPGSNALMVVDGTGFPAPRPGNSVFPPGTPFSATIAVNGRYRATVLNESMPGFAVFIGNAAGAPVQDRTGLTGTYDIHLEYVPNEAPSKPSDETALPAAGEPGPALFDALQTQLGLKLTPKKVPVEMLVVDRAERVPLEN